MEHVTVYQIMPVTALYSRLVSTCLSQQLGTVTFLTNSYKGSELQTTLFTQA